MGSGTAINVALVAKLSTGIWFQSKSVTGDSTYVRREHLSALWRCHMWQSI